MNKSKFNLQSTKYKIPNTNHGITLVALIITIIVLLILAGVTIATLIGDNGLLQKATTAKEENEKSKELELLELAVLAAKCEGEISNDKFVTEFQSAFPNESIDSLIKTSYGCKFKDYIIYKDGNIKDLKSIKLPSEYQRVEYIKNANNSQFIDTEVPITKGYRIKARINFLTTNQNYFCGTYTGMRSYIVGLSGHFMIGLNSDFMSEDTFKTGVTYEIDASTISGNGYFKLDGDTIVTSTQEYTIPEKNCYLFKVNGLSGFGCAMELYEFMLYDENNTLVRHFIPCKTKIDEIVGLYDVVENKFYTNDPTTGSFVPGPEI